MVLKYSRRDTQSSYYSVGTPVLPPAACGAIMESPLPLPQDPTSREEWNEFMREATNEDNNSQTSTSVPHHSPFTTDAGHAPPQPPFLHAVPPSLHVDALATNLLTSLLLVGIPISVRQLEVISAGLATSNVIHTVNLAGTGAVASSFI